jgi:hypothetical protein
MLIKTLVQLKNKIDEWWMQFYRDGNMKIKLLVPILLSFLRLIWLYLFFKGVSRIVTMNKLSMIWLDVEINIMI